MAQKLESHTKSEWSIYVSDGTNLTSITHGIVANDDVGLHEIMKLPTIIDILTPKANHVYHASPIRRPTSTMHLPHTIEVSVVPFAQLLKLKVPILMKLVSCILHCGFSHNSGCSSFNKKGLVLLLGGGGGGECMHATIYLNM